MDTTQPPGTPGAFDEAVDKSRQALITFIQGDSSGMKSLYSTTEDVVLANPLGPPWRGRDAVCEGLDRAVTFFKGGTCEFEEVVKYAVGDLGYVFQIERAQAKLGDAEELKGITLRVTMIYRRESEGWQIVHRQADPIMTPRSIDSVLDT